MIYASSLITHHSTRQFTCSLFYYEAPGLLLNDNVFEQYQENRDMQVGKEEMVLMTEMQLPVPLTTS